jgi:hypothetical protein
LSFAGQFDEQIDSVAMDSPLSLVMVKFFMEKLKKMALNQAAHTPLSWICYVDDTFSPHGPDWLREFLDHLNSVHQNTEFTMQMERDDHLPFLDIDIYGRADGSLANTVYCKPTHTNLYLNSNTLHHPSNKHAILSILVHRARALCDHDSFHAELVFLGDIFRQICRALNPLPRVAQCDKKPDSVAFLPCRVDMQLHQQGTVST